MRDLFMLAILPLLLYPMFKRPFIAVGMWLWTALFFPNGWVYGMASGLRYNLIFTAIAIVGYVAMKHKPKFRLDGLTLLVLFFFVWTTVSTMLTVGRPDVAWEYWNRFAKTIVLFLFVLMIVEKKLHLDFMLGCVVLSVGFYADLEALKFIASGGGHKIAGFPGHVLGDRNELSIAFCMTLPICYYLLNDYGKRSQILRYGLLGTIAMLVFAVVGTQSRGGFIALLTLGGYLFLKSERKILMGILGIALIVALGTLVSDEYIGRMDTIESATDDASFMGRVVAWKLSFILAMQNPLFGGGFKALENFAVWSELSRDFFSYSWFYTGDLLPNTKFARAAHSIYFQVLGDQGFVGLALYVAILGTAFLKAGSVARRARKLGAPDWLRTAASMVQLSIFAFALGAAALSFAYFDLIFALVALVVVLEKRLLPAALAALPAGAGSAAALPVSTRAIAARTPIR